jgi:hypothetical protein
VKFFIRDLHTAVANICFVKTCAGEDVLTFVNEIKLTWEPASKLHIPDAAKEVA